jgi:hypothetical protein
LVENTQRFYRVQNNYCIGIVNQACQLQDMALASMYTYPSELVQICEKALESDHQILNQDDRIVDDTPIEEGNLETHVSFEEKEMVSSAMEPLVLTNIVDNGSTEESSVTALAETDALTIDHDEEDELTLSSKSLCEKHAYVLVDYLCSKSAEYSLDQLLMLLSRAQVFIGDFRLSRDLLDPITEEENLLECFEFVRQKLE